MTNLSKILGIDYSYIYNRTLNPHDHVLFATGADRDVTPASVVAFVTGAPSIPPIRFDQTIKTHFINDKSKTLPTASKCSLVLQLLLSLAEYEDFKQMIDCAIQNTVSFGQVQKPITHEFSLHHLVSCIFTSHAFVLPSPVSFGVYTYILYSHDKINL